MIGLDTTALIDLFRGDKKIEDLLFRIDEEIILNHIIYLELMFGLDLKDAKHKDEEKFYNDIFSSYKVLNLSFKASKKSSEILKELKSSGKTAGFLDCSIAGIYISNNITKIITKNRKHFENIKGLKIISY